MYRRGICRLPLCFFCSLALPSPFRSSLVLLQLRDSCTGCVPINLGTGMGYSVMEVVKGMEEASGKPVPYKVSATLWWGPCALSCGCRDPFFCLFVSSFLILPVCFVAKTLFVGDDIVHLKITFQVGNSSSKDDDDNMNNVNNDPSIPFFSFFWLFSLVLLIATLFVIVYVDPERGMEWL